MTFLKRFTPMFLIALIGVLCLSGCTDISKSSKYETHKLTYLVNTTNVEEDLDIHLEDLKNTILQRVRDFQAANVSAQLSEEDGKHYLTVELGTIDPIEEIQRAIEQDTSFILKKQFNDESDYKEELRTKAETVLQKLKDGADFETTAQNAVLEDPSRIVYIHGDYMYRDEIIDVFAEELFSMEPGSINEELIEYTDQPSPLAPPIGVLSIVKLFDKKEVERVIEYEKEVEVSHILIAYEGAMRAADTITRTKEEARELANELVEKINSGEDFATLAREYSDDLSNNQKGGVLDLPAGQGTYVEQFENAALTLEEEGELAPVTETPFGYHLIQARTVTPATEEKSMEEQVKFGVLFFALTPAEWELLDFNGETLSSVEIRYDDSYDPYLVLHFTPEGASSIKTITEENMKKVLGIFLGKELVTSFTVKEVNEEGNFTILKPASSQEADMLQKAFLTDPLPLPIILQESEQI
ncbi:hypothetical protein GF369_00605 [Candidatus Peregrinibacteria bacterium]|nr:hypothetical protein [Candidatus Peregrinibacteria bacterium]